MRSVALIPLAPAFLALAACASVPDTGEYTAQAMPIHDADGQVIAAAQGVWQSRANGWILDVDVQGITRWQDAPGACYRADQGSSNAATMGAIEYRYITPAADAAQAVFQYLPGDTPTRFTRLATLPERCSGPAPTSETEVFDLFAGVMAQHYGFFAERNVDWDALVADARPRVRDGMGDAALFEVMGALVEALGDSHTKLIAQIEGEGRRAQGGLGETLPMVRAGMGEGAWLGALVEQVQGEVLDPGSRMLANGRMIAGTMAQGRIGYLQVFTMGGFVEGFEEGSPEWAAAEVAAFDAAMDEVLGSFAQTEAMILDLSNNRGGYDVIARAFAERLTDRSYLAYTVTNTGGGVPVPYVIDVAPEPRYAGPIYLLTSDVTVSGGELATLALRQNPRVTQAGGTTRGSFSTPLAKPLPNGWYLELSNEEFRAPDGTLYEGRGIAPHWPVEVYPPSDPVGGHRIALEWLADAIIARQ